jgi:hypothetical protein
MNRRCADRLMNRRLALTRLMERPASSAEPRPAAGSRRTRHEPHENRPLALSRLMNRALALTRPPGSVANACQPDAYTSGAEAPGSTITSSGARAGRLTPLR